LGVPVPDIIHFMKNLARWPFGDGGGAHVHSGGCIRAGGPGGIGKHPRGGETVGSVGWMQGEAVGTPPKLGGPAGLLLSDEAGNQNAATQRLRAARGIR